MRHIHHHLSAAMQRGAQPRRTVFDLSAQDILSLVACRRCNLDFDADNVPLSLTCTCVICSQCARKLMQRRVVHLNHGGMRHQHAITCVSERSTSCTGDDTIVKGGNVATMKLASFVADAVRIFRAAARLVGARAVDDSGAADQRPIAESQFTVVKFVDMGGNLSSLVVNTDLTVSETVRLLRASAGGGGYGNNFFPHLVRLFIDGPGVDSEPVLLNDGSRTLDSYGIAGSNTRVIKVVVLDGFRGGEFGSAMTPGCVLVEPNGSMRQLRGVAADQNGQFVLVCDTKGTSFPGDSQTPCLWKLTHDGKVNYKFHGDFDGVPLLEPSFVCLSPCGRYAYLSDSENFRVLVFDIVNHEHVITLRSAHFGSLSGVCTSTDGRFLFATCSSSHRLLMVCLADGANPVVRFFGGLGSDVGEFNHPTGLSMSPDGTQLLVADSMNHRVQLLACPDPDSDPSSSAVDVQRTFGGVIGSEPGQFRGCVDAKMSFDGTYVYVADQGNRRVQVMCAHTGTHVHTIGGPGSKDGQFFAPYGIALDERAGQQVLLVSDNRDGRIQTFSLPAPARAGVARAAGDAADPIVIIE